MRSFVVLGFGTIALTAACGGKIVDIGGQSTSQTLTPSTVSVANSQCGDGYAHPSICCTGGSSESGDTKESSCESWPDEPFHPCPDGWTTYPNAAACCSLDNPADCTTCSGSGTPDDAGTISNGPSTGGDTPTPRGGDDVCNPPTAYTISDDGGTVIDGGVGDVSACDPRCPPGYTGVSPFDVGGCCIYNADGSGSCFGEARAGADDAGVEDGGSAIDAGPYDGGSFDAGTGGDDGGFSVPPSDPICDLECPPGWFLADAAGGVCCNNDSSGNEECFAIPLPDDTGGGGGSDVPPSGGSGGVNPGGPEIDAGSAPTH